MNYNVDYELEGRSKTQVGVWASDPGKAMAICLKEHPGAKIIKAWKEALSGNGFQEWFPPPVHREPVKEPRPARALKPNERGCEMPFYDEVVGRRKF